MFVLNINLIEISMNFCFCIIELCGKGSLDEVLKFLDFVNEFNLLVEDDVFVVLLKFCEWKRVVKEGLKVYLYICNLRVCLNV